MAANGRQGAAMATKPTKQQVIETLESLLKQVSEIEHRVNAHEGFEDDEEMIPTETYMFQKWHRNALVSLRYTFGPNSREVEEFSQIDFYGSRSFNRAEPDFIIGCVATRALLESMVQEVQDYWDEYGAPAPSTIARENESGQARPTTNKVFIVHGHDDALKQAVARVLHQLDLDPIILQEKPDQQRTIIEKFSDYADVSFAIALFTPDDIGGIASGAKSPDDLKRRARQNVVFEFGYFIGRLGRSNACALVKGDIEFPSDYSGVVYIRADDAGSWRFTLVRELRAAGFDVDANRLL
jgi:predicted nucleotide-binding protein